MITIRVLTCLLIPIVVRGVLGYLRQSKETQAQANKVQLPNSFAILGMITSFIFLIPAIITVFSDEPVWITIILLIFSLLGAVLMIAFANCRISYDEEGFVSKNFFGIKRKFTYDQVTAIKEDIHEKYIYIDKRKVRIDEFSAGGTDFIKLVKKKYRTMHEGQSIPKIYKTKYDIFNGNVNDVKDLLIGYSIIGIVLIGFLILTAYSIFAPSTVNNTTKQSVSFISCDVKTEEVVLTSTDNQIYKIRFVNEQFDAKEIQALCDGEKIVTTYSKKVTPDDHNDYHSVQALVYNDSYILSFEQTNKMRTQEQMSLVVFAAAMCLIWAAFIICSVIIGRNPKKFNQRVVRLFFRKGYLKY